MNNPHQPIEIELDPQNPAHFFACCGLLELAGMYEAGAVGAFDYDIRRPRKTLFRLSETSASLTGLLTNLRTAIATAPEGGSGGEAPVTLSLDDGKTITLDWWLDTDRSKKSRLKLWAGNQTTLHTLVLPMLNALPVKITSALLDFRLPMSGRFGLDPRSAWNTLDFGSSVNEQGRDAFTFPAAEMLGAVGLAGFRPRTAGDRRRFACCLWFPPLPLAVARAAAAGALPEIRGQTFVFEVVKRGAYSCFTFAKPQ